MSDSDSKQKSLKLLGYWLFSTVVIVFGAITAYIGLFVRQFNGSMMEVMRAGFPIWGITAAAAILIYVGYYFYTKCQM
jgi:hypothetical protein